MASKKKESEAFNLLKFMYQDDDDDMEDADKSGDEEDDNEGRESQPPPPPSQEREEEEEEHTKPAADVKEEEDSKPNDDVSMPTSNSTPKWSFLRPPTPVLQSQSSLPEMMADGMRQRRDKPAIVDYGHDDVAMSPEPEEGEILGTGTGRVIYGDELVTAADIQEGTPTVNAQMTPSQVNSPYPSAQVDVPQGDALNNSVKESETEVQEDVNMSEEDTKDADPLDKFLPPPPQEKCSDELQDKINKFLAYKRHGKSFNAEVRNRKDYRNPDFLLHAVRYQDIDQIGSCFSRDVFDPHGYDESDFYDAIEADMKREMERKEQERKKNQKVEFVSGGAQGGIVTPVQKVTLPSPGGPNLPSGSLQSGSTDALAREGRQNKKSKWDKVDGDRRNMLVGQDTISAVGAHAALLTAANAGAGYAIFAQQKRREAEEKRSSDKRRS